MQVTNIHIQKFQALYKEHVGKDISKEKAHDDLLKLVRAVEIIYKPMTKAEFELVQKRRKELGVDEIKEL